MVEITANQCLQGWGHLGGQGGICDLHFKPNLGCDVRDGGRKTVGGGEGREAQGGGWMGDGKGGKGVQGQPQLPGVKRTWVELPR